MWLAEETDRKQGPRIDLSDDGRDKPLDDATAALVFRGVREVLTNVSKHAGTHAATIGLRRTGDQLQVDVEDKGVGFDPKEVDTRTAGVGFGLFSVREQIGRLGGTVVVTSAPRQGTRVTIRVPLKAGVTATIGASTEKAP